MPDSAASGPPANPKPARILTIAGSDSGGGAGVQGDLKTITMLGGYGMSAITALTAQNTQGVFGIHEVPPGFIRQQIALCLTDIGADAIKTGMLHSAAVIEAVAEMLAEHAPKTPLVVDPVMVAKGGAPLLEPAAVAALIRHLLPRATLLTPNIPEAALLANMPIHNEADMHEAATRILALGARAVLMKGGHAEGDEVIDMLFHSDGTTRRVERYASPRLATRHTHGTGCTLASAIATGLGQGLALPEAATRARAYVMAAIRHAPGLGQGHGPLGHNWSITGK